MCCYVFLSNESLSIPERLCGFYHQHNVMIFIIYHDHNQIRIYKNNTVKKYVLFFIKTFMVDASLVWPKPIEQVISLEKFRSYRLICENCHLKRFSIYGIVY